MQQKQTTFFEEVLPNLVYFNLKQLEDLGVFKIRRARNLINQEKIDGVRIGAKFHIGRNEVIRYLTEEATKKSKQSI